MTYPSEYAEFRVNEGMASDLASSRWPPTKSACLSKSKQRSLHESNHDYPRYENVRETRRLSVARFSKIVLFAVRGNARWLEYR